MIQKRGDSNMGPPRRCLRKIEPCSHDPFRHGSIFPALVTFWFMSSAAYQLGKPHSTSFSFSLRTIAFQCESNRITPTIGGKWSYSLLATSGSRGFSSLRGDSQNSLEAMLHMVPPKGSVTEETLFLVTADVATPRTSSRIWKRYNSSPPRADSANRWSPKSPRWVRVHSETEDQIG